MNNLEYLNETMAKNLSRDKIFLDVFKVLNERPIKFFELGTSHDDRHQARYGNGWSSMFWCIYIKKNGGELTTCDINQKGLDVCKRLLSEFPNIKVKYHCGDGLPLLRNNEYDFIYLDGSDDPNEMLEQISLCNLNKNYILCDDFHTKGILIKEQYPKHRLYRLSNGHEMALFGREIEKQTILI